MLAYLRRLTHVVFDLMYWQLNHRKHIAQCNIGQIEQYFAMILNISYQFVRHFGENSCMNYDDKIQATLFIDLFRSFKMYWGVPFRLCCLAKSVIPSIYDALTFQGINFVNWLEIFTSIIQWRFRKLARNSIVLTKRRSETFDWAKASKNRIESKMCNVP